MTVSCFINQVIDYNAKVVCNTRTTLCFLLHRRELRILRGCAVHVFELVFAYLAICSHKLGNGDRDNLILSFLRKVNK